MAMRYQPQGLLRLVRTPLTAAMRLAVLPGVNRGYDAVSGRLPTVVGTKVLALAFGLAAGFGATFGTGAAADRITTGLSGAFPAVRTYEFEFLRNGPGGGGLGRLFDKTNGGTGQYLFWYAAQGVINYGFYNGAERNVAIPGTGAIGELITVRVTHAYVGTTSTINAWVNDVQTVFDAVYVGALNDAPTTALTIGNRAADMARGWDGGIVRSYVWDGVGGADLATPRQNPYSLYDDPSEDVDIFAAAAAPNSYTLTAAPGTFGLAGSSASLRVSRKLASGNGVFTLTGPAAALRAGRRVVGATGVITLAGSAVTLRAVRRLAAAAGAFTLAGGAAQLVYSPAVESAVIVTSSGQFVLTGAAVAMRVTRRLQAQPGSFALSGAPVSIFVAGGKVDVSTISPARIVVFEGSGSRIVPFGSSGSRVTPFGGSGSRVTPFEGSGSRTVRFE